MYELKKSGKVFTGKCVGTGPSSYEKRIYRAAVSQRLRNTVLHSMKYRQRRIKNAVRDYRLDKRFNGNGTDQRV